MHKPPSPFNDPTLRDDLPRYPPLIQLVRVTSSTVTGPTGFTSSSIRAASLYVASTQQLRDKQENALVDDSLFPRDREPCLALDSNGLGIPPGYHIGRLAGSWHSLPVYEIAYTPPFIGATGASPTGTGISPTQIENLLLNFTQQQINNLYNLNPCQFQTFVEINASSSVPAGQPNISTLQLLTNILSPQQISTLTYFLTPTQITGLITRLSVPQLQTLTTVTVPTPSKLMEFVSVATPEKIQAILNGFTTPQLTAFFQYANSAQMAAIASLTPAQITSLGAIISVPQLQALLQYDPATIIALALQPAAFIQIALNINPIQPGVLLGCQALFPAIPKVASKPSAIPTIPQGYAQIVTTDDGNVYVLIAGVWQKVGASAATTALTNYTGTTTNAFATIFDALNANGLNGQVVIKNTGVTNSLTYQITATDMFGSTTTQSAGVTPGNKISFSFDNTTFFPPLKEFKLELEDTIAGNHTTYSVYLSTIG